MRAVAPLARRAHVLGALGAVLAVTSVVLGAQGRVLLHQCLAADGPLAALGVRLAVLRSAAECPDGTLGLGATSSGAVLLLSVALPVVATHLLLAACGLGLGVVTRRAVDAVAALLATHLAPFVGPAVLPDVPGRLRLAAPAAVRARPHDRGHDPRHPRRGPPVR